MDLTLILHSLSTLLVLWSIILLSFILGLPLASIFLDVKQKNPEHTYLFFYVSTIVGYTVLNLSIFFATLIFNCGTDKVAIPTLILILLISVAYLLLRKEMLINVISHDYLKKLFLIVLLPVASFHIILPILIGKWDMAYSTGDDASRWFMVVDYFRHNVFEYWKVTNETLVWRLGERPLQNVSGAIICSIFNTNQANGYSLSSASSSIMACLSFCLLVESMFPLEKMKSRYLLWAVAIAFFGFFGVMTNIFYTGRTTHHFSIYPVIASLSFVAVKNKFTNRFLWFLFWNVSLAYYYSIRFSLNYLMVVFVMIAFQWIFREIKFKSLLKNYLAYIISFAVAVFAAWGEVKVILESITSQGMGFFLMQRGKDYGSDGTAYDRFMKWSGFISTYELADSIPSLIFYGLMGMVIFAISAAVYKSIKSAKKSPGYLALIAFNIVMATNLFLTGNYYVAWKSALYWPTYVLIGLTALSIDYFKSSKGSRKTIGIGLAAFIFLFIGLTGRQFDFYWGMTDQRFTKVDKISYEMVKMVSDNISDMNKPKSQIKIFGLDYGSERHLLLREIFKEYGWQPVRQKELWFSHDITIKSPELMDDYRYDFLLYANTFGEGEWLDLSGNKSSLIYSYYPFSLFTSRSSFVEFTKGIETTHYEYDVQRDCLNYGELIVDDTSQVTIVNNGYHSWYRFRYKIFSKEVIDPNDYLTFYLDTQPLHLSFNMISENEEYRQYSFDLKNLSTFRLARLMIIKKVSAPKIIISKVSWGY
ncbi:MAG: hypothetical protein WC884_03680 [Candidatus Paceibacterota bacterium]